LFFFFQAEDGIRDFHVTGVQTCALPISKERLPVSYATVDGPDRNQNRRATKGAAAALLGRVHLYTHNYAAAAAEFEEVIGMGYKIGRASCREGGRGAEKR